MSGFGGGLMQNQGGNGPFKSLLNGNGSDGSPFGDGKPDQDLGSMHMRDGPSGQGRAPGKGGGMKYGQLLGNLLKIYNPMGGQGPYG